MGGSKIAAVLSLVALAGAAPSTGTGTTKPATAGLLECRASVPLRDRPVFAIGISDQGRICWETPLTRPKPESHISSQPLVSGGQAFLDSDGFVFDVESATGQVQWRWDSYPHDNGHQRSSVVLAVADGRVVATNDQGQHGQLVGLDEAKGSVDWRFVIQPRTNELLPTTDAGIAVGTATSVQVIDDRDGKTRWREPARLPQGLGAGLLIVTPGRVPVGGDVIERVPGTTVHALREGNGKLAWKYLGHVARTPQVAGNLVFFTPGPFFTIDHEVVTTAVDRASGRVAWTLRVPDTAGSQISEAAGALLLDQTGTPGRLARLDPATGHVMWQVPTQVYTVTAAGGELVGVETSRYLQGTFMLVGRDPSTGAVKWRRPVLSSGAAYVSGQDAELFALTGPAGPTLVEVVGSSNPGEQVTGIDPATGRARWSFTLPDQTVIDGIVTAGDGLVMQISDLAYTPGQGD